MNWIPFGRLGKTHGLKGELKFYPVINDLKICRNIFHTRILTPEGDAIEDEIESVRGHRSPFILKLKGINSIEQAKVHRKSEILALREEFGVLPEGRYFSFDIKGLEVFDEDSKYYGRVEEVLETKSNDVYVVQNGKSELLLPAIDWVIQKIDLKNKKLIFRVVKGLLDANEV